MNAAPPWLTLALLTVLSGCGAGDGTANRTGTAGPSGMAARDLDALAVESGALPDQAGIDPVGRYGRNYEGGRDRLCLVPEGREDTRYRFGAETRIGEDEYCRGRGTAKRAGDNLILRFDGTGRDCQIVARYDGDQIVFPGALDVSCAQLCSSRGSFAGVTFPRVDRDAAAAARMADGAGRALCR